MTRNQPQLKHENYAWRTSLTPPLIAIRSDNTCRTERWSISRHGRLNKQCNISADCWILIGMRIQNTSIILRPPNRYKLTVGTRSCSGYADNQSLYNCTPVNWHSLWYYIWPIWHSWQTVLLVSEAINCLCWQYYCYCNTPQQMSHK
jgi:hypothetical protein